jgi:hypothetical protein
MHDSLTTPSQLHSPRELSRLAEGLPPQQVHAFQVLLTGGTVTAAAAAAGVSRPTIYSWLEPEKPLRKLLGCWKSELADCARTKLLMMTDQATTNVALSLKTGDVRTALILLEKLGVLSPPAAGPTLHEVKRDTMQTQLAKAQSDPFTELLNEPSWTLPPPTCDKLEGAHE